jgi:ABC-type sulfate transport system permease component
VVVVAGQLPVVLEELEGEAQEQALQLGQQELQTRVAVVVGLVKTLHLQAAQEAPASSS